MHALHLYRIDIYKILIASFTHQKRYLKALNFCKKVLKLSWVLNLQSQELEIYD